MFQSFIIAFSMYSRIPMPHVEWNKKSMRYAMCFFPLIGLVIGGVFAGGFWCFQYYSIGKSFATAILTAIPFWITGGIHMDGFLDTIDARHSYGNREKKLEILKDPHIGAFAVLFAVIYFVVLYGCYSEVTEETVWLMALGFIFSRAFSALALVLFPKAKKEGTLAAFSKEAGQKVVVCSTIVVILVGFIIGIFFFQIKFLLAFLAGGVVVGYYRWFSWREFGGITGDLAGYFLQMYEIVWAVGVVMGGYFSNNF